MILVQEEGFKGNRSVLPFLPCVHGVIRFPSPLCILAEELSQWYALGFQNFFSFFFFKDCLPICPPVLGSLTTSNPSSVNEPRLVSDDCVFGGLEANPPPYNDLGPKNLINAQAV